jgi:phospholipase C
MISNPFVRGSAVACAALTFDLQGCSAAGKGGPANDAVPARASLTSPAGVRVSKYIKHVVIVIQENRTVPNFFGGFPGADAPTSGNYRGTTVPLTVTTFKQADLNHLWEEAIANWDNGKMDNFANGSGAYTRIDPALVKPLWTLAKRFVFVDRMFPTEFGPSFTAHLDLIASTANLSPTSALADLPNGAWRCDAAPGTATTTVGPSRVLHRNMGPFPCLDQFNTMAQVLDAANVSWKYYAAPIGGAISWSAFAGIKYVWGPRGDTPTGSDWPRNIVNPQTTVLKDAAAGTLPAVAWVVPDYRDSDHPGNNSDTGPSWVTAIANAVGQGPDWNSTAIVVVWDDWGGFYDDAPPPQKDFVGLGIRVPCLIISPYAKKGYVSHTQYEFGSVLKFVEQAFDLPVIGPPSFGYTDMRSNSLVDSFNFTQKPRPYVKVAAKYPIAYFLHETPSMRLPDDI